MVLCNLEEVKLLRIDSLNNNMMVIQEGDQISVDLIGILQTAAAADGKSKPIIPLLVTRYQVIRVISLEGNYSHDMILQFVIQEVNPKYCLTFQGNLISGYRSSTPSITTHSIPDTHVLIPEPFKQLL